MLFCSLQFVVFFAVVFTLYWAMPWHRARVWLLLIASYYFYASWNQWLAMIICLSTVIDYLIARGMDTAEGPKWRKVLLTLSLVGNLGLLFYFKYVNFFLHSMEQILTAAGLERSMPVLSVFLPIGISFYTFEAINYTIDVYRRRVPAERNLANFMLFITFFPHLVAGPIVRARDFLPQIKQRKHWQWARIHLGVQFFVMGLFKKLAIADRMALFADPVFANPDHYGSEATWIAVIAYAVQIYCDFSGYTDMALGTAHMLGYKLARNFDMPYLAANVSEFWRRWHISLSSWLRDYLFIPLGGSRGPQWFVARNLMITMTLGGLWHGASWNFVIWGVLHGTLLILHRQFQNLCDRLPSVAWLLRTTPGTGLRMGLTFVVVCLGWVFFRSTDFGTASTVMQHLFTNRQGLPAPLPTVGCYALLLVVAVAHCLGASGGWRKFSYRLPGPALGMSYGMAIVLSMLLTPDSGKAFIYFQF